ncbi:MAG: hypothetical protein CMN60_06160 [Sphingobium sp.]|nr:hypothetical protein [Sphingobium sp.]|tara:strand:+ start:332 stop:652 length:321 start_codon:yes stop_codon:yes gene_type:complete
MTAAHWPGARLSPRLFAVGAFSVLCACAAEQRTAPVASGSALAPVPMHVTCTVTTRTNEPCRADAERQCNGTVRLLNVSVAETLPPPTQPRGIAGQTVYQATYNCN